ncbi:MAG TPA: hypothetical protein DEB39_00920 [Planctomycetaceae bacterium]|nr:hypothetical protein [Planctomycetaceae bacterium]
MTLQRFFAVFAITVCAASSLFAEIEARYVRIDNPTGYVMEWRQVEIYVDGQNVLRDQSDRVTGTCHPEPGNENPTRENTVVTGGFPAREITNGDTDTAHRASEWAVYSPPGTTPGWNPWFEIDLGRTVRIDKIVCYASRYPDRFYLDKGHRTICATDENRKVVWAEKWNYYDKNASSNGVFTWTPRKTSEKETPVLGLSVPAKAPGWVPMDWVLETSPETPPRDGEERMKRFENRESDEAVEKLAVAFFNLLDESTPGLENAFEEFRAKNHRAALDAWKRYWFKKIHRLNQREGKTELQPYPGAAEDLLAGVMVSIMPGSAKATRFTPGRIRWVDLPEDRNAPGFNEHIREVRDDCEFKGLMGSVTRPLLSAYRKTPEAKYIRRWAEITDDWAMNFFSDVAQGVYEIENMFSFQPGHNWCLWMEELAETAVEHPELIDLVPSTTLARAQMLAVEKYPPAWWRVADETIYNHNYSAFYAFEPIVHYYIDEFLPGQRARKVWKEGYERILTLGNFRDGVLGETIDEGHMEFPVINNSIVARIGKNPPEWYTPGWRNHYFERNDSFFKVIFRHPSQGGYDHRDRPDYRPYRWTSTRAYRFATTPPLDRDVDIFSVPEIKRLIAAWGFVSQDVPEPKEPVYPAEVIERRWKPTHEKIAKFLGGEKPELPKITSDWMPYTGSYYFRGGWKIDDPFLAMVAAGAHGGAEPWLATYGMYYMYDYNFPLLFAQPVHIDGCPPQQIHGMEHRYQPGSKTSFLVSVDEKPMPHRWVSTQRLDFGEAVFEGAYQRFPDFRGGWDDESLEMVVSPPAVENGKTTRQIVQLRQVRMFLVIDRVETGDSKNHGLSIPYKFALSTTRDVGFSREKQLKCDPVKDAGRAKKNGTVRVDNPEGPSLTLRQFADKPIQYQVEGEAEPDFRRYACRIGERLGIAEQSVRLSVDAESLVLVSLLTSRESDGKDRIASIRAVEGNGSEVTGFSARLNDETKIECRISVAGSPIPLSCSSISAEADTIVAVTKKSGESHGFILGARSLAFAGRSGRTKNPDFEFYGQKGTLRSTPILTPVSPVVFKPDRNVFIDSETVEMTSETPDVEIRYTTDGTPPGRDSTLYTGPVTITENTEFAARAYRLRNGRPYPAFAEDFEINGTKFSVPSFAFFRKTELKPAETVVKNELESGLDYEYLEAPWWRLFSSGHWLPAQRTGIAERELDISSVETNGAYCIRYKGFLEIEKDGVYTFHVPEEMVRMICAKSYDLRLYIDDEEWSPSQFWHALGNWSIPLKKGFHRFQIDFADARTKPWHRSGLWRFYPRPWAVHKGPPGDILVSGPGMERTRIPKERLFRSVRGFSGQ